MKKMLKHSLLVVLIFSLSLTLPIGALAADTIKLSRTDVLEITESLREAGVYEKDIRPLIQKLRKGEVWDSMNPDKMTPEIEQHLTVSLEEPYKTYRFEDGSLAIVSLEPSLQSDFGIMSTTVCGTGYCNYYGYKVSSSVLLVSAQFYADFSIIQGTNNADRITRVYDHKVVTLGGNVSEVSLGIDREIENVNMGYFAEANLRFVVNTFSGGTSSWLRLSVGRDSFSVSRSF